MRIGEQLKAIRRGAGLTQENVAEKLCITRQALSNWEQGKTIPDLYSFAQLAAVYHFSPDEFLLGKSYFKGLQNMKTNFSDPQIEQLIRKFYPNFSDLTPLSGGLVSQTFSFRNDEKIYVFQIGGKRQSYEKEYYISKTYHSSLPFREVLKVQETDDGIAYCISDYINGCQLDKLNNSEQRKITASVIDIMDRIAQIKIPVNKGFGFFDSNGDARYQSWPDFISVIYNDSVYDWSRLALKRHSDTSVRKAIEIIRENIDYLQLAQASFVLGDFNVLADGEHISGLIDCDLALYGDPLYCVASQLFWDVIKTREITAAVVKNYMIDEDSKRKTYCYILRYALEEIYNTAILNEIGYDIRWTSNRLDELLKNGLCHTELMP